MRRKNVSQGLKLWGLKAQKVTRVRSVFRVLTAEGEYSLKATHDSPERIYFFDSVLRYVQKKGFLHLSPYIHTLNNEPFAVFAGENLVLTPWVGNGEIRYRSLAEILAAVKVLANFHQLAEGYQPEAGIKVRDKQGKWVEKLAQRCGDIEFYLEQAEKKQGEFDKYFLKHADWIWGHTKEAFQMLRDSEYQNKVLKSKETVQICHGDPASRNFVINRRGQVYLIDFDSLKFDLPVIDLWRFFRRIMSRDQWDLQLSKELLNTYTQVRTLDSTDYQLLAILLRFPEKIWRILHKYYEKRGRNGWSEERYLRKLKELLQQSTARDKFLQQFSRDFCQ